jgi:hypothetical protein
MYYYRLQINWEFKKEELAPWILPLLEALAEGFFWNPP